MRAHKGDMVVLVTDQCRRGLVLRRIGRRAEVLFAGSPRPTVHDVRNLVRVPKRQVRAA